LAGFIGDRKGLFLLLCHRKHNYSDVTMKNDKDKMPKL